jgi:hypothetical protein
MKTRSIIIVVITLVIGFILGMLTSAEMRYRKLKPVKVYFSEERFRDGFYQAIQPDDKQKEKIDLILDKYAKINGEIQDNFRKELDASMKEFRSELDLNLSKEQIERLKDMDDRRQDMIMKNRKFNNRDSARFRRDDSHHRGGGRGQGRTDSRDSANTSL